VRALLLGAAVSLAACGAPQAPPHPAPDAITVEAVGDEPWSVVQYALAPGFEQHFELTLKVRGTATLTNTMLQDNRSAQDFPGLVLRMRAKVTAVTPEGDAKLLFEVEQARVLDDVVDPSLRAAVASEIERFRGTQTTARLSPNGTLGDVESTVAASSPSRWQTEMVSALHANDAVFPDAPIGVGAVWRVTSHPTLRGARWTRVATYTLRARTASTVDVEAAIEMTAESQPLRTEPNASLRLTGGRTSSTLHARIALAKIAGDASAAATTELNYLVVRRHERLSSTIRIDSITSTAPLDDIAP
jgi:hypothetical protein